MANRKWVNVVLFLLSIVLALSSCKKNNSEPSTSGGAGYVTSIVTSIDEVLELVNMRRTDGGLILWENEVTETDVDRATGWISRGRSNLRITGSITVEQLQAIAKAISDIPRNFGSPLQLVKLDLAGTTGLVQLGILDTSGIGSLLLPEGLTTIPHNSISFFNLLELQLPESLQSFSGVGLTRETTLPKIVFPAACNLDGISWSGDLYTTRGDIFGTIVLKDGHRSVNFGGFRRESFTVEGTGRIVLPPSLESFFVVVSTGGPREATQLRGITEIYSYAVEPPLYRIPDLHRANYNYLFDNIDEKARGSLNSVLTVYVPAGSESVYENAWFNYTAAEFKPIPANMATIDRWY